jgi:hypothetical protein
VGVGVEVAHEERALGIGPGSLDHVLASPAAAEAVTGSDIWDINANESVGMEYSGLPVERVAVLALRSQVHVPVLVEPEHGVLVGVGAGSDIWDINANESVGMEYSRANYNVVDLYAPDQFRIAAVPEGRLIGGFRAGLRRRIGRVRRISGLGRRLLRAVTGSDIWDINANESVGMEYSRANYNVVDLYAPDPGPPEPGSRTRPRRARAWGPRGCRS